MNLYLCVMENTEKNNIHTNQILPLIKDMKALFISPLFIISKAKIGLNGNVFDDFNVHEKKIPLVSYNFLMYPFLLPFFFVVSVPILTFYIQKYEIQSIHCRNLLSSVLAIIVKKIFYKHINIISDFRGHYPEEGVIISRWKYNSITFKFWKWVEKKVLIHSNTCTFISENMKSYYYNLSPRGSYYFAPAIVDTKKFYYSSVLRDEIRKTYNISEEEVVYIYTGSHGQWHDLGLFYSMIEDHIQENRVSKYRVFILSGQKNKDYQKYENKHRTLSIYVKPEEVNSYLCAADIGVLPGTTKRSISYDLLYNTMISSKAEEYFCTGLDVLSNKRIIEVEALSSLINKFGSNLDRAEVAKFYANIFSVVTVNEIYKELYKID